MRRTDFFEKLALVVVGGILLFLAVSVVFMMLGH